MPNQQHDDRIKATPGSYAKYKFYGIHMLGDDVQADFEEILHDSLMTPYRGCYWGERNMFPGMESASMSSFTAHRWPMFTAYSTWWCNGKSMKFDKPGFWENRSLIFLT